MTRYKLKTKVATPGDNGRWYEVGILILDEDKHSVKIKVDVLPVVGWDGWLSGFTMEKEG